MNTKAELLAELNRTDQRTRELITSLDEAQLAVPYEPGINPPVWELGHAAFFTEYFFLRVVGSGEPRMPGSDAVWDSFQIPHRVRWRSGEVPDRQAAWDYYATVLNETRDWIETHDLSPREHYLARYSVCHQNMHLESLVWCRQTLGYPPPPSAAELVAPAGPELATGDAVIPGGRYPLGMPADSEHFAGRGFAFDAEMPGYQTELEPFAISRTLVSNREFLAFVEAGGYENTDAWSYTGACWLRESRTKHPLYWRRADDDRWQSRWFDQWADLAPDAPVMHVSYWEAEAFCNWAGRRLPTEAEWEATARGADGRRYPWGDDMDEADRECVDMDGTLLGRAPVHALSGGATPEGCVQMLGTAWEWTSTQFLPYDGFKVDMYPFMSTLQFGDHKVAKGGSCATSSCLIRNSYRQSYLPDRRDVYVSFRTCAR